MKGVSIFRDASTEDITKLSTGPCRDVERWKLMPPLDAYSLAEWIAHNLRVYQTQLEILKT